MLLSCLSFVVVFGLCQLRSDSSGPHTTPSPPVPLPEHGRCGSRAALVFVGVADGGLRGGWRRGGGYRGGGHGSGRRGGGLPLVEPAVCLSPVRGVLPPQATSHDDGGFRVGFANDDATAASLNGTAGVYSAELIVGDLLVANTIRWHCCDIDIALKRGAKKGGAAAQAKAAADANAGSDTKLPRTKVQVPDEPDATTVLLAYAAQVAVMAASAAFIAGVLRLGIVGPLPPPRALDRPPPAAAALCSPVRAPSSSCAQRRCYSPRHASLQYTSSPCPSLRRCASPRLFILFAVRPMMPSTRCPQTSSCRRL